MIRPHGVGLYAPSGFAIDPEAVDRAVQRLEAMWEHIVVDPTCRTRWQRFSAPDDERLAAVVRMANDPSVGTVGAARPVLNNFLTDAAAWRTDASSSPDSISIFYFAAKQ